MLDWIRDVYIAVEHVRFGIRDGVYSGREF